MVDILETAHRQEGWSNTRLEELGTACGINYDPDSIIFDKSLRSVINPIDHTYWDWMHGLVASGGVAQLEVNGFCHAIVHAGISLESIDQFHAQVLWPCASRRDLSPQFFQKRVAEEPSGHIKAFAAETLSAVTVLAAFAVMVLQPAGSLPVHCTSMLLLATILDCFGFEAVALAHLDFLDDNVQRHHLLVVEVYGHIIAKFKMHQIYHCLQNFRKQRKLMSCCPMERKHKTAKGVGQPHQGHNLAEPSSQAVHPGHIQCL